MRRSPARRSAERRLVLGLGGLTLIGSAVHGATAGPIEVRVFRAVNGLPDGLYGPAWVLMQGGNVAAAPLVAASAYRLGRRRPAAQVLLGGLAAWALAKVVKRVYRRPRPAAMVDGVALRGRQQVGLGYVSGHAAVSTAIALAVLPELSPGVRTAAVVAVPVIGASRLYVGAHLPLDVVGGAALGLTVNAAVDRLLRPQAGVGGESCQLP